LVDLAGNINTSGRDQRLDPAGNIDPASKELLAFLQQVPKMDADASQERLATSLMTIAGS
jgi:hypothetical protein